MKAKPLDNTVDNIYDFITTFFMCARARLVSFLGPMLLFSGFDCDDFHHFLPYVSTSLSVVPKRK